MNCDDVRPLLGFGDAAARPSGVALRDHLIHCPRCRQAFPEVVDFLGQRPADAPGRRDLGGRRRVAVATLVLAFLGAGAGFLRLRSPDDPSSEPRGSNVAAGVESAKNSPRWRLSGTAVVDSELVQIDRERTQSTVRSYVVERRLPLDRRLP